MSDVHIPTPSLSPRPVPQKSKGSKSAENDEDDALEDWNIHIESLFEWVGMACLGAQRWAHFTCLERKVRYFELRPLPDCVPTTALTLS